MFPSEHSSTHKKITSWGYKMVKAKKIINKWIKVATVCYWKSCCQQSIFSGFGNQPVTIWDTTFFLVYNNDKLICMFDVAERGKFARHNIFPYSCLCMKPMLSCSLTPSQRANWISNCFLYMINLEVKVWSSIKNSNFTCFQNML